MLHPLQELIDDVLVALEDRDLRDLVLVHPVDVGAPDLNRRADAAEALTHEQRDAIVAAQHVDQLELDLAVSIVVANRLDVADRGVPSLPIAGEPGATGDVDDDVIREVAECGVPVATLGGGQVMADELTRGAPGLN
jgi:hypothetical protein